jgi:hypothetical protein
MNIKVFTIVLSEDDSGKKYLSWYGNMNIREAIGACQEIFSKEEKIKAVEEYKRGTQNGSDLPKLSQFEHNQSEKVDEQETN